MNTVDRFVTPRGVKSGRDSGGGRKLGSGGAMIARGASIFAFAITNTPSRSRASTRPRATSSSYAACAVFFDSPSCFSSARTGGNRLPAGSAPVAISRCTLATMSAAVALRSPVAT
jgi:hypothetical protein